jgi:hypothetical protein
MKPSERRAMQAEKRAEEEVKRREAELTSDQNADDTSADSEPAENEIYIHPRKKEDKPYKRKEGFFQSHIRLITFIITTALVLFVVGPVGIDMLVAHRNAKTVDSMQDISIETIYSIYDNADIIQWSSFKNFNYTDYSDSHDGVTTYERTYPVKDSRLVLKVGGESTLNRPEYIQLIDYRSGKFIDVYKYDPREFIRDLDD